MPVSPLRLRDSPEIYEAESQSSQHGDALRLCYSAASIAARLSGVSKLIRPSFPPR